MYLGLPTWAVGFWSQKPLDRHLMPWVEASLQRTRSHSRDHKFHSIPFCGTCKTTIAALHEYPNTIDVIRNLLQGDLWLRLVIIVTAVYKDGSVVDLISTFDYYRSILYTRTLYKSMQWLACLCTSKRQTVHFMLRVEDRQKQSLVCYVLRGSEESKYLSGVRVDVFEDAVSASLPCDGVNVLYAGFTL
tara:strand:+ start:455 stop:1021 length:567 start_codon:yes stop_codon:yes gene_type:complete